MKPVPSVNALIMNTIHQFHQYTGGWENRSQETHGTRYNEIIENGF